MFSESKGKYFRGSGFTDGQGPAEVAANHVIFRTDAGSEQRNYMQQSASKHLRLDDRRKEFGNCFDTCGAAAFSSTEKVFKATGKERNSESGIRGTTPKCDVKSLGQLPPADTFRTFLTDERRQENESSKRNLEVLKKKTDQVYAEELDPVKAKFGKEKNPFKRVCDGDLLFDKEKLYIKDRTSGKLKSKESEKERKKERQHYSLEKVKKSGRERETPHIQNVYGKERDQTRRDEKGLGIVGEKKEAQQDRQKDESDRGKGKKMGLVGLRSGNISGDCIAENDKKYREKLGKITGSGERRKRKGTNRDEKSGKDMEKDAKGNAKEKGCSSETKDKGKHHSKKTDMEEKVKGRDKDFRNVEKRTKHSSSRGREHSTGKSSKEIEKVSSGEEGDFGGSSYVKTKNSSKDALTGESNNSHLPYNPLLKTEQVIFAKEQLSKRCSADSDIFGRISPAAESLTKSSDKKSATLDSDDSLDNMWICPECSVAYVEGATDMVGCDACDNWFHWNCVGLLVAPPDDAPWYCQNCAKKKLKKKSLSKSSNSKKGKK
ncbi:unnamed protein product [Onchocerca flexuosa]|uniref:PHD-type domain-containing protein n=1 Tax=Onchocerca flexuosa TaxID=387005 RepID=A0A183H9I9_9BILA|nr:unnamed protein product [Onchocerca flexuosa]